MTQPNQGRRLDNQSSGQISRLKALLSEARAFSDTVDRERHYHRILLGGFILAWVAFAAWYTTHPVADSDSTPIVIGICLSLAGLVTTILLLRRLRRRYATRLGDFDKRFAALVSEDAGREGDL